MILIAILLLGASPLPHGPEAGIVAATPADKPRADELERQLTDWMHCLNDGKCPMLLFAIVSAGEDRKSTRAVRVESSKEWPDDTVDSVLAGLDENHRLRFLQRSPTSESGDWSLDYIYIFDAKSQTSLFRRYFGTFNSECAGVAKETSTVFFSGSRVVRRDHSLTDEHEVPLQAEKCDLFKEEYSIAANAGDALADKRLIKLLRAAGARF